MPDTNDLFAQFLKLAHPTLVPPRFTETRGPWLRLGEHETRVPSHVVIATTRASDGRHIAVLAHLDSSPTPGTVQILVSSSDGVRELVGLSRAQFAAIRETFVGR